MSDLKNEPVELEPGEFPVPAAQPVETGVSDELELTYATGLEVKSRSQWAYARRRFVRHRLAMISLVVLIVILGAGFAADYVAPYAYDEIDLENSAVVRRSMGTTTLAPTCSGATTSAVSSTASRPPSASRSSSRACRC